MHSLVIYECFICQREDANTHIMILVWDGQKIEFRLEWRTILVMHPQQVKRPICQSLNEINDEII